MSSTIDSGRNLPLYTISITSQLTQVSPVMIREYEKAGLIKPFRVRGKRRFTQADVGNIRMIRYYLIERGMTLNGLKVLLQTTPCYMIKTCDNAECPAFKNNDRPCWETVTSKKGCDVTLCPSCPLRLCKSNGKCSYAVPRETPTVLAH